MGRGHDHDVDDSEGEGDSEGDSEVDIYKNLPGAISRGLVISIPSLYPICTSRFNRQINRQNPS